MEGNLQGGGLATTHVKTEALDEHTSAPVPSSQEPPVCGGAAGGGEGGGEDQTAEELQQAAASKASVLLCE